MGENYARFCYFFSKFSENASKKKCASECLTTKKGVQGVLFSLRLLCKQLVSSAYKKMQKKKKKRRKMFEKVLLLQSQNAGAVRAVRSGGKFFERMEIKQQTSLENYFE